MSLVLKTSGGPNIALRQQKLPLFQPVATTDPVAAELFWRVINADGSKGVWNPLGTFGQGARGSISYNPAKDQNVEWAIITYSASGVPNVSRVDQALVATLLHQRETDAPTIGQNSPATADSIQIGITGFTRFARYRRVTVSANADMSAPLGTLLFNSDAYAERELPRYFILKRDVAIALTTEGGSELTTESGETLEVEILPVTVYVTVAHSGGTAWTPESNILEVTFAGESTPGSPGTDFDPTPRDESTISL